MKVSFNYNVPAYLTFNGDTDMFLPVLAKRTVAGTTWDIDKCEGWKLVNIKSWAMVARDIEQLANEKFMEKMEAAA